MVMVKTETELSFWLDGEGIKVFVGDDEDPTVVLDLMQLVHNEVMMYAVPATAQTFEDIKELHDDDDGIEGLRDSLRAALNHLDIALEKKRE